MSLNTRSHARGALLAIAAGAFLLLTAPAAQAKGGLSNWVMQNGRRVAGEIQREGGYNMDGRRDCYGFVRRTWNPILEFLRKNKIKAARFESKGFNASVFRGGYLAELPVDDYRSPWWRPIDGRWDLLVPGDVLGTVQGHTWGGSVDYGLYAGKKDGTVYQFSNGGVPSYGPVVKPYTGRYQYYYVPTHILLKRIKK